MLTVAPGKPVCACRAQGSSSRAAQIRVSSEGQQGAVLGALLNPTCSLVQLLWTERQSWPWTLPSLGVSSVGWRGPRGLSAGPQEDRPRSSFGGFSQRMRSWPGGWGLQAFPLSSRAALDKQQHLPDWGAMHHSRFSPQGCGGESSTRQGSQPDPGWGTGGCSPQPGPAAGVEGSEGEAAMCPAQAPSHAALRPTHGTVTSWNQPRIYLNLKI